MIWPLNRRTADTDFPVPADGQPIPRPVATVDIICPHCKRHGKLPATQRGMVRCKQCQFAWDPIAEQEAIEKQLAATDTGEKQPHWLYRWLMCSPKAFAWRCLARVAAVILPGSGQLLLGSNGGLFLPFAVSALIAAPLSAGLTLFAFLAMSATSLFLLNAEIAEVQRMQQRCA